MLSANRQCALMHIKTCTRTRLFVQLEQSKVWREEKTHTQNIKQRIHPSVRELYRSLCVYLKHYWLKMHDRNRRALRYGCVNKLCKSTIKAVCSQRTRVLQLQPHWSNLTTLIRLKLIEINAVSILKQVLSDFCFCFVWNGWVIVFGMVWFG